MKFVIAVVMLALAIGAQSSVLPLAPVSYTAVSGAHLGHGGYYGGLGGYYGGHGGYYGGHGAYYGGHGLYGGLGYHGGYAGHYAAPAAVAVHAPAAVAVHAPVAHASHALVAAPAHGGTYVAKTRGAEHVAPLPGHVHSAASINLQPAPGTW